MQKGNLVLLSGPSGVGKDTLIKPYKEQKGNLLTKLISATSRLPRENHGVLEMDGVDYYFRDVDFFQREQFLEKEEVYPGKWYGTPIQPVIEGFNSGAAMLKDIDVDGNMSATKTLSQMGYGPNVVQFGVIPKSIDVLRNRLEERDGRIDSERIDRAAYEIDVIKQNFDPQYIIVNDDLETATIKTFEMLDSIYGFKNK